MQSAIISHYFEHLFRKLNVDFEADCACLRLNLLVINGAERNGLPNRTEEIGEAIGFHDGVSSVGERSVAGGAATATATVTVTGAAVAKLTGKIARAFAVTVATAAAGSAATETANAATGDSTVSGSAESRAGGELSDSAPGAQAFDLDIASEVIFMQFQLNF